MIGKRFLVGTICVKKVFGRSTRKFDKIISSSFGDIRLKISGVGNDIIKSVELEQT